MWDAAGGMLHLLSDRLQKYWLAPEKCVFLSSGKMWVTARTAAWLCHHCKPVMWSADWWTDIKEGKSFHITCSVYESSSSQFYLNEHFFPVEFKLQQTPTALFSSHLFRLQLCTLSVRRYSVVLYVMPKQWCPSASCILFVILPVSLCCQS